MVRFTQNGDHGPAATTNERAARPQGKTRLVPPPAPALADAARAGKSVKWRLGGSAERELVGRGGRDARGAPSVMRKEGGQEPI
jgi:hypothetical protein